MDRIKLSEAAKNLKPGIWEHYKGGQYEVLGVAFHSETLEEMVIYRATYGERFFWVRPLKMFLGKVLVDGKRIPRFRFVNPTLKEA